MDCRANGLYFRFSMDCRANGMLRELHESCQILRCRAHVICLTINQDMLHSMCVVFEQVLHEGCGCYVKRYLYVRRVVFNLSLLYTTCRRRVRVKKYVVLRVGL